jgi:hypothetical protein
MERYAAEGHFKAGSMGPKVDAAMRFVRSGGEALIASLTDVNKALAGKAGTRIVPARASCRRDHEALRERLAERPPGSLVGSGGRATGLAR